jgi:hypothetical protein
LIDFYLFVYDRLLTKTLHQSYNDEMVNPKVVRHPSMAKTTVLHASILQPLWYGQFSPHHTKPIDGRGNGRSAQLVHFVVI